MDKAIVCMFSGNATTVEEWLKNSQSNAERVAGIMGGVGEIMEMFAQESEAHKTKELLKLIQTKPADQSKRTAAMKRDKFQLGTNARQVGTKDGKILFKEKRMSKEGLKKMMNKFGGALSTVLTAISPVFLIGELIWGDTQDQ